MKKKLLIKSQIKSIKRKVKEIGIKIIGKIKKIWRKHIQTIICFGLLVVGGFFIYCEFKGIGSSGICLSLGTGIITSSIVSFIINWGNDRREKRRRIVDRDIIFRELVNNCTFVYLRKIREINTVAAFSFPRMKFVGSLFDDFSTYQEFEKNLQSINFDEQTDESKQRFNQLFDFQDFEIKALAINYRGLAAENYLAMNLLEEEEFEKIGLRENREVYFDEIDCVTDFYNHKVLDYDKCIEVLNHTMKICSDIISLFDWAIKEIKENEFYLEQYINTIDTRSREEIEEDELRKAEKEAQYWAEHQDEYEAYIKEMEELSNRTEEDRILDEADRYINGISFGRVVTPKFEKLDPQSDKVKKFFARDDIQNSLKKERAKRKLIEKHLGEDYLKKIKEEKEH